MIGPASTSYLLSTQVSYLFFLHSGYIFLSFISFTSSFCVRLLLLLRLLFLHIFFLVCFNRFLALVRFPAVLANPCEFLAAPERSSYLRSSYLRSSIRPFVGNYMPTSLKVLLKKNCLSIFVPSVGDSCHLSKILQDSADVANQTSSSENPTNRPTNVYFFKIRLDWKI